MDHSCEVHTAYSYLLNSSTWSSHRHLKLNKSIVEFLFLIPPIMSWLVYLQNVSQIGPVSPFSAITPIEPTLLSCLDYS